MFRSLVLSAAWTPSKHSTKVTGQTLVLLSAVPLSCTLTDIRSLAYKPPNPYGKQSSSAPRDSSSSSLAASITSIEFQRTVMLNQSGKVLVRFRDASKASEFERTANERILGGNKIRAEKVDAAPMPPHPLVKRLYEMQQQSPGRVVMIKGLPSSFTRQRVEKILSRSYALATETKTYIDEEGNKVPMPAVFEIKDISGQGENYATNFLVQLQTVSSAMTLVRRWHRSVWRNKELEKSKYDQNEQQSLRSEFDEDAADDEEDLAGNNNAAKRIDNRYSLRTYDEHQSDSTPPPRVLDAILMY